MVTHNNQNPQNNQPINAVPSHRPILQVSEDSRKLYNMLAALAPGQTVSYEALTDRIGRDVRVSGRSGGQANLRQARKMMEREGTFIECVPTIGMKRVTDSEAICNTSASARKRLHNTSRRAVTRLTSVKDFDALSQQDQIVHNASVSLLGTIAGATTERRYKAIEHSVTATGTALPDPATLDVLKQSLPSRSRQGNMNAQQQTREQSS